MWHGHPFSQRNKTSEITGEWSLEATDRGVGQNFKKGGRHNIGCVRNPLPTMTHKELFWKKDVLIVLEKSLKWLVKEFIFRLEACCFTNSELNHSYFWRIFIDISRTRFHKYIWVAASWNYIVSTVLQRYSKTLIYFGPASITLDTKSVVKIKYHVPITSATKLKKHKVRN